MASVKTITEQIYDSIYALILDGTYPPGTRLTTKILQEDLGVSSSPIREALTRLQQDGLVDYQPNSGMSVRCYSEQDVRNLFRLMSDMDALALKYAIESSVSDTFLERLSKNTRATGALLFDTDIEEWQMLSDKFHTIITDASGNPFLKESLQRIYRHITVFSSKYVSANESRERIQSEHERIAELLCAGSHDEAVEAYRAHVLSSMEEALKYL